MLLKFPNLEPNQFSPAICNTKFRKLPGLQYLRASCTMHAISRYWETRPKIIDFIFFVGSEKSLWLSLWLDHILGRAYTVSSDEHHQRASMHGDVCTTGLLIHQWFSGQTEPTLQRGVLSRDPYHKYQKTKNNFFRPILRITRDHMHTTWRTQVLLA